MRVVEYLAFIKGNMCGTMQGWGGAELRYGSGLCRPEFFCITELLYLQVLARSCPVIEVSYMTLTGEQTNGICFRQAMQCLGETRMTEVPAPDNAISQGYWSRGCGAKQADQKICMIGTSCLCSSSHSPTGTAGDPETWSDSISAMRPVIARYCPCS